MIVGRERRITPQMSTIFDGLLAAVAAEAGDDGGGPDCCEGRSGGGGEYGGLGGVGRLGLAGRGFAFWVVVAEVACGGEEFG